MWLYYSQKEPCGSIRSLVPIVSYSRQLIWSGFSQARVSLQLGIFFLFTDLHCDRASNFGTEYLKVVAEKLNLIKRDAIECILQGHRGQVQYKLSAGKSC